MLRRARTRLAALCATLLVASAAPARQDADPEAELRALDARRKAAIELQEKRYAEAKTDEDLERAAREAPWSALLGAYERFAREHAGRDVAVSAWTGALELAAWAGRAEVAVGALAALDREHLASARLAPAIEALANLSWTVETNRFEVFLRRVAVESPHRAVQGFALFALAESLVTARYRVASAGSAGEIGADELAKRKQEARALLAKVLADFADTPPPRAGRPKDWVARRAASVLYELEHLQVGMVAPDFEAVDEDGAAWKLSDYRGRVVLLDFWGNW